MKIRKKPVVIEAVELKAVDINSDLEIDGTPFNEHPDWLTRACTDGTIQLSKQPESDYAHLTIKTLEGNHLASPGDFIIQGVHGELYPCKPDIFAKTYEPA